MFLACNEEDKQADNPLNGTCWTNAEARMSYAFGSETITMHLDGKKFGDVTYSVNGSNITFYGDDVLTATFTYTESTLTIKDGLWKETEDESGNIIQHDAQDLVLTRTTDCTGSEYAAAGIDERGGLTEISVSATTLPSGITSLDSVVLKQNYGGVTLAKTAYSAGGFTLPLPASMSDEELILNLGGAKWWFNDLQIYGYKGGAIVCRFLYSTYIRMYLGYVNADVTYTGAAADVGCDDCVFNINVKKGWFILYWDRDNNAPVTNVRPNGTFGWQIRLYGTN